MKAGIPATLAVGAEFCGISLGDKRLDRRALLFAERFAGAPQASFPNLLRSPAELEAMYRFFQNDAVEYSQILDPHTRASATRCAEHEVVRIAHDSSMFAYEGERKGLGPVGGKRAGSKDGFVAHVALAISPGEERAPLGTLGMETHVYQRCKRKRSLAEQSKMSKKKSSSQVLSRKWLDLAMKSQELLGGRTQCIHVMDREADAFAIFFDLIERRLRFVIRGAGNRRTKPVRASGNVQDKLDAAQAYVLRTVPLAPRAKSRGSHHARDEREARLSVRASRAKIARPSYSRTVPFTSVELNVVEVFEAEPPEGEEPISWVLYTTEEIETHEQIVAIVDHYRARWRIEEFFKCLKTGCSMEKRQLGSYEGLVRALALFVPIAWMLLALRTLSRIPHPPPASVLFDEVQMQVIRSLAPDAKLSKRPTIKEVMLTVAKIGGHIKWNGEPGWIVLARGYSDFVKAEIVWRSALAFAGK